MGIQNAHKRKRSVRYDIKRAAYKAESDGVDAPEKLETLKNELEKRRVCHTICSPISHTTRVQSHTAKKQLRRVLKKVKQFETRKVFGGEWEAHGTSFFECAQATRAMNKAPDASTKAKKEADLQTIKVCPDQRCQLIMVSGAGAGPAGVRSLPVALQGRVCQELASELLLGLNAFSTKFACRRLWMPTHVQTTSVLGCSNIR